MYAILFLNERDKLWLIRHHFLVLYLCSEFKLENSYSGVNFCRNLFSRSAGKFGKIRTRKNFMPHSIWKSTFLSESGEYKSTIQSDLWSEETLFPLELCISQIEASTPPRPPRGHTPDIWHLCHPGEQGIWLSQSSRGWGIWTIASISCEISGHVAVGYEERA